MHVGGLLSDVRISPNPFGGSALLSFTVRNVSKSTFDATADFWMEGPFGNRVAQVDAVTVSQLKAGESRVVSAELPGVGQWAVLTAHATFRPPAEVEGTQLSPLTRDVTVFVLPWMIVSVLLLAGIALALVQLWRSRRMPRPMTSRSGCPRERHRRTGRSRGAFRAARAPAPRPVPRPPRRPPRRPRADRSC